MRNRDEAGETLVEIVLTIVIFGLAVGALLAAIGTAAGASKEHRELATADVVLRSYAEATKQAVRDVCVGPAAAGTPYTVTFTPQDGFTATGGDGVCPPVTAPVERSLVVTDPDHLTTARMKIVVRTS
jgi:type II secretory pathway pseudopilin PulG